MKIELHPADMILWHPIHHRSESSPLAWKEESSEMKTLVEDVSKYGILVPLIVTSKTEDGGDSPGYYYLVDGRNRLKAALLTGLKKVPVIVLDFTPSVSSILRSTSMRRGTF